jgi:hypothetical protein
MRKPNSGDLLVVVFIVLALLAFRQGCNGQLNTKDRSHWYDHLDDHDLIKVSGFESATGGGLIFLGAIISDFDNTNEGFYTGVTLLTVGVVFVFEGSRINRIYRRRCWPERYKRNPKRSEEIY